MSNIEIATLTKALIQKINLNNISTSDLDDLKKCIAQHDTNYYVFDNPTIADVEYDTLFKALKTLEENNPSLITSDSPTQRVAHGLNAAFKTVPHLVPMLSLENSYNENDLIDWDRKCKALSGEPTITYCVEPKFDGASISLLFENDKLTRAATRGDGIQGDDITTNAKQIRSIPLQAPFNQYGFTQVELRGEAVITKERFKQYNEKLMADQLPPLANPRNASSGSLRMKDPKEVAKRHLDIFIYNISYSALAENKSYPDAFKTHYHILKTLANLGIKSSFENATNCQSMDEVIQHIKKFEEKRDELPYEIDGMVIKVNEIAIQDKIGQTSHHPRWAIAYKFKARQATSTLLAIEYQVGRTGSITPVAKIEPVYVGGVTISSLSLFNEDVIREKNLMIGDTVLIERAGDVIPYVVKSFPELRKGNEQVIVFPKHCPVCNETLSKPADEAVWRCVNMNCEAQVVEKIIHYTSKDAMDIRGLGEANVRKFFEQGMLHSIVDLYHLPFERIKTQDGFGSKSIEKLQEAIALSKKQPLHRLIFALGIRYVGETTAKTLARSISHLAELYTKSIDDLLQLEDVGIKVATSIVDFFHHQDNLETIQALENIGVNINNTEKQISMDGGLQGKSFLFTGTLSTYKRAEAEALVEKYGGIIVNSVSSKLNYLVVGEDAGSKLEKAKKLETVHILSEEEFAKMLPI